MMDVLKALPVILLVMLFYSFGINLYVAMLPEDEINYVESFQTIVEDSNVQDIGTQLEDSLDRQRNIPLIELGALVFYSGNIILDLILNFVFAIPQMFSLLLNTFLLLFNVDTIVMNQLQLFATSAYLVIFVVGLLNFVAKIRSGQVI